jgi:hypothetical protein
VSVEVKRLSWRVERQDSQVSDLRAVARQDDSRIAMLRDQLGRSQAELESMSSRFTEVAAKIPDDIGFLGDRLSAIFKAASSEAEEIRAEACRFADTVRVNAEEDAAGILAEAQLDYQLAAKLRDDVEMHSEQARADIARLQDRSALEAAEILAEAKSQAEELLVAVHRQVDAQVAAARTKLDDLNQVRAKVVAQLKHFYDTFNTLERPWGEVDSERTMSLAPAPPDANSAHGAHSVHGVDATHDSLGDVG